MQSQEQQYHDLLRHICDHGAVKSDRTGTGTKSVFGYQMRFDIEKEFPLLTTKKVFLRGIIHELLWFMAGDTNIQYLAKNGVKIWNEWPFQAYLKAHDLEEKYPKHSPEWKEQMDQFIEKIIEDDDFAAKWGELGPVYGRQWRDFGGVDQITKVIDQIKNTPDSRRMIVSAWNPTEIDEMAKAGLPPCHTMFQFYVVDGRLSCQLYQRSADVFLGVPFNIASYALLVMMMAQVCGLKPGEFVHTFGDAHLYLNHMDQVEQQLSREFRPLPTMKINPDVESLFDFTFEDFELVGYDPHPAIKAPIAI